MQRNHLVTFHTRDANRKSIPNEALKPRRIDIQWTLEV